MTVDTSSTPMRQMSGESSSSSNWGEGLQTVGLDVSKIQSILLSDGWHNISNPQITKFAVGSSHSPFSTPKNKYYATLQYQENGNTVYSPFSQISGFCESKQG